MPAAANPLLAHWTLDPGIRFLNHGSFGASPREVLAVQAELRARMEREPVEFLGRRIWGALAEVKEALGAFVGASPRDLALVPNATTGVNAVLGSLALEPGDEIVITSHGYNACNNAARAVAARAGARVAVAAVPFPLSAPDEVVAAVLAAVGPRTRLVLVDHVTSPTGLVLPIERLVGELRERGVEVLVDGAHAPGMVELDLDALGADYYTGNCHKWLCAPKGAGFLHVRRERQARIRPPVISHGANALDGTRSRFELEFAWMGTVDPSPYLAVPAALEFLGGLLPGGWAELRRRGRTLALRGRDLLCAALAVPAPAPAEMIGFLAAVPLPEAADATPRDAFWVHPLQQAIRARLAIEVPVFPWPAPPRQMLRISAAVYNSEADYAALAAGLPALLSGAEGRP
ncbi:MAG: aminotransferase class V-fold PLP-dependent enzyme [Planctomycetota bacterium]